MIFLFILNIVCQCNHQIHWGLRYYRVAAISFGIARDRLLYKVYLTRVNRRVNFRRNSALELVGFRWRIGVRRLFLLKMPKKYNLFLSDVFKPRVTVGLVRGILFICMDEKTRKARILRHEAYASGMVLDFGIISILKRSPFRPRTNTSSALFL